jgi:RNA polymerase sigma-70 factor (ECF subfamily)
VTDEESQTSLALATPPSDETDLLLLDRVAAGDRDAFHELYVGYHQRLLRFIYRVTRQLELAEEGVNDVMLVVWRKSESFERRSKVSTWIMGIAFRKALKLLHGSRRWRDRFKAVDFGDWSEGAEGTVEPSENRDLRDLLDQGLRGLSPEQRAVVELTYFAGCSYQEIAAIAGCPVNTVKTRMFHARAKLRKVLPLGDDSSARVT